MSRKSKRSTNDKLARVIALGFKGLEKKLVEVYRGIAGLIEALRSEMHKRFDRIEKIERAERKNQGF